MKRCFLRLNLVLLGLATLPLATLAAESVDPIPRTVIMSAFAPEWTALQARLTDRHDHTVNNVLFATGTLEHHSVVLFLSGVSMVNAAMNTQLALDHFTVNRIVFSGIAGGVNPALSIGDVVVPDQWSEYLESVFAREKNGTYVLPDFADKTLPPFSMIFPQPVEVATGAAEPVKIFWFPVDPQLLNVARSAAAGVVLSGCTSTQHCLPGKPKIVVGGRGVSGQSFVDNAAFRKYVRKTFDANVLDMESAAVAHVAYANKVPFIAFRSLSDLAGGGPGANEMGTFFQLAADNSAAFVSGFVQRLP